MPSIDFYNLVHDVLYQSPIYVAEKHTVAQLYSLANEAEVGRKEALELYKQANYQQFGISIDTDRRGQKIETKSLEYIRAELFKMGVFCPNTLSTTPIHKLVRKIAYSRFGEAFHLLNSSHDTYEISLSLYTDQSWLLYRVLDLEKQRARNLNTLHEILMDYITEIRNEKQSNRPARTKAQSI